MWRTPGGRDLAAAYLLPRAETALRQELQRLADAGKRAREGQRCFGNSDTHCDYSPRRRQRAAEDELLRRALNRRGTSDEQVGWDR